MRSREETRRDFLLRMARGAAFVVPSMTTLSLTQQGGKGGGGGGKPPGPPGPPPGVSPPIGGQIQMMRADPDQRPWKARSPSSSKAPWTGGPGRGDGGGSWPPAGGDRKKPPRE